MELAREQPREAVAEIVEMAALHAAWSVIVAAPAANCWMKLSALLMSVCAWAVEVPLPRSQLSTPETMLESESEYELSWFCADAEAAWIAAWHWNCEADEVGAEDARDAFVEVDGAVVGEADVADETSCSVSADGEVADGPTWHASSRAMPWTG